MYAKWVTKAISARKSTIPLVSRIVVSLVFHPSRVREEGRKDIELSLFLSRNICVFRVRINNIAVIH